MPLPLPRPSEFARHFQLDPGMVFLNHGSFGATPRIVHDAQRGFMAEIERDPVAFFVERLSDEFDKARAAIAPLLGCGTGDIVFVPNATQAVATVLDNLAPMLKPGDEVLANTHEYPACMNNLRRIAGRAGATVVVPELPFPVKSADELAGAILGSVTPRTRVAMISQTTSPSGLVLPITKIVRALEDRGIITIVDGAHGVGFTPLDIASYGCSYYTTNCHKWLCTPKGVAVLYVREDRRGAPYPGAGGAFRPMVLSNMAEKPRPGRSHFHTEFDYVGTTDVSAIMTIAPTIAFLQGLVPGGLAGVMERNHALVIRGRDTICRVLGTEPAAPDALLGSLATIPLPRHPAELAARLAQRPTRYHDALQDRLVQHWKIQVPLWSAPPGSPNRVVRISAQIYNTPEQYEYLAGALREELAGEARL